MTARIRVLVVDDAVVVRKLVTDVLSADPALEVVGIAANGRIALQKIEQLLPDILTLDVEMPEMDGLETIVEIRKRWPKLPVIMFSTLTERGAGATLEALARGATDYVTKPANVGSVLVAQQRVRDDLIPKIKGICGGVAPSGSSGPIRTTTFAATSAPAPSFPIRYGAAARVSITPQLLAIGASTGGPNALAAILPKLPAAFPLPIVITQHMPPMFTKLLAERLNAQSRITVREAFEGAVLTPGTAWVAPGDHHMTLARDGAHVVVRLNRDAPEHSCRPAVDVTFRSAHAVYAGRVLAVVLTGMGRDGMAGAEIIKRAGGAVLAQDEATSVVWGMPGFVANAGIADAVVPLEAMAESIMQSAGAAACR